MCGTSAVLAFPSEPASPNSEVSPNDIGFTCPNQCRPSVGQIEPTLDVDIAEPA
jgi:hypothetical protein